MTNTTEAKTVLWEELGRLIALTNTGDLGFAGFDFPSCFPYRDEVRGGPLADNIFLAGIGTPRMIGGMGVIGQMFMTPPINGFSPRVVNPARCRFLDRPSPQTPALVGQ